MSAPWGASAVRPNAVAVAALLAAGAVGATAAFAPVWSVAASLGGVATATAFVHAKRLPRWFLVAVGVLLLVYLVLGKGGAYLNIGGVFVGEMVLAAGLLGVLFSGVLPLAFRTGFAWGIVAFCVCGALQTVPYLAAYGRDALRDAVVWGYGVFALFTAACLTRTGWLPQVAEQYGRWLVWFPFWVPPLWAIYTYGGDAAPTVPGTGGAIPLVYFKSGDPAFHLTGIAAFVILGLHQRRPPSRSGAVRLLAGGGWLWWAAWLIAFAITAAASRASLLAMLIGLGLVPLIRPATRLWRPAVITVALTAAFFSSDVRIEVREGRYLSPQEMIANLGSFTGYRAPGNRDATREWRLQWWTDIVNYTVFGPYFLTGKGFGVNLAIDDGYSVGQDEFPLRSPHNGHLSILARSGVPGMLLWMGMQAAFAIALLRGHYRMRRAGEEWWSRVNLWLLAYWAAFQVNGAFEVSLEGPHGGIWFWCLFGFGMAALDAQRRLGRADTPAGGAWPR